MDHGNVERWCKVKKITPVALDYESARTRLSTRQEKVCLNLRGVEKHLRFFQKRPSLQLVCGCQKRHVVYKMGHCFLIT